jgi:tetrahydromethanopterin S-methyltransferase subunit G
MVIAIPPGWQFPSITEARLSMGEIEYTTPNYKPTEYMMMSEMHTSKGTKVRLEVVYLQSKPEKDEGPFLKEERNLINMLVEMLKIDLERREAEEKIIQSAQLLKKITSQVPANTYMFEIKEDGRTKLLFSNRGTDPFIHKSFMHSNAEQTLELSDKLYEEDRIKFNQAMKEAYHYQSNITFQYRVIEDGNVKWRWMKATPEKGKNGTITWYGATSDITPLIEYIASIEQVLYDISHVIRRPICTMLGMTKLISNVNFSEDEVKEISKKLHEISKEMDNFISELNHDYQKKKEKTKFGIDFNSSIDKRNSLFNY